MIEVDQVPSFDLAPKQAHGVYVDEMRKGLQWVSENRESPHMQDVVNNLLVLRAMAGNVPHDLRQKWNGESWKVHILEHWDNC